MHDANLDGWQTDVTEQNAQTRFYVTSGLSREWLIYREGVMNPIENYRRKTEAVEHAKMLARQQSPSEVLVEQRDGSFKLLYSFERDSWTLTT